MSKKYTPAYADPKGSLVMDFAGNVAFGQITGAPTASAAGYAKGCILIRTDGAGGTNIYTNVGTTSSASWQGIY